MGATDLLTRTICQKRCWHGTDRGRCHRGHDRRVEYCCVRAIRKVMRQALNLLWLGRERSNWCCRVRQKSLPDPSTRDKASVAWHRWRSKDVASTGMVED